MFLKFFWFPTCWKGYYTLLFAAAYRIHIHQSTVQVLRELNLGYKVELRGRTDVKARFLHVDGSKVWSYCFFPCLPVNVSVSLSGERSRGDVLACREGWIYKASACSSGGQARVRTSALFSSSFSPFSMFSDFLLQNCWPPKYWKCSWADWHQD